jgi:hypothetical protein
MKNHAVTIAGPLGDYPVRETPRAWSAFGRMSESCRSALFEMMDLAIADPGLAGEQIVHAEGASAPLEDTLHVLVVHPGHERSGGRDLDGPGEA